MSLNFRKKKLWRNQGACGRISRNESSKKMSSFLYAFQVDVEDFETKTETETIQNNQSFPFFPWFSASTLTGQKSKSTERISLKF